jgi:hypothetical protein
MRWLGTRRPPTSAVSDLPQYAAAQKRGTAVTLARKGDNLLREPLSFAFGFVGQVEGFAEAFECR